VNWSFQLGETQAFWFGGRSVQIVRFPFSYRLRELEEDPFGLTLRLPVSFGLYDLAAVLEDGTKISESLSTLTVLPGVEIQVPVGERWLLKPFAEVGAGKDFSGGHVALLWGAGFGTLGRYPWQSRTVSLGSRLWYRGGKIGGGGEIDAFLTAEAGLDVRFPTGLQVAGRSLDVSAFGIVRRYFPVVTFVEIDGTENTLAHQLEAGFTFDVEPPLRFLGIPLPPLGVSYGWGDGLSSVRLTFGFPF